MQHTKTYVVGTYKDEEPLFAAIDALQKGGVKIDEVYTPYPVHGLDKILGMKDTRLHIGGFIYGVLGLAISLTFMSWVMLADWPINYGGKPLWSLPAFVPILFEFTVLSASVGMMLTFLYVCQLFPTVKKHHFSIKATDDTFALVVKLDTEKSEADEVVKKMKKLKALTVEVQVANPNWWFGSYAGTQELYKEGDKSIIG